MRSLLSVRTDIAGLRLRRVSSPKIDSQKAGLVEIPDLECHVVQADEPEQLPQA